MAREPWRLWGGRLLTGLLVFVLVAAPWYVWVTVETKGAWTAGFFLHQNLDRFTGALLWDTEMADYKQHYGTTSAPLVVKDLVLSGTSGGDEGARGFIDAYRVDTGERAWRFWAMPAPGEPVFWLRVPSCKINTLVMQESDADALQRFPAARTTAPRRLRFATFRTRSAAGGRSSR